MSFVERVLFGEPLRLDRAARAGLSGTLAQLSDGKTYYEINGPTSGKPVILIHGFSMPSFIWDNTFSALAAAGFKVIRYDLYGRGWSDRPQARYDKALFVRQLAELMEALKLQQASLVSLSMGGVIAAEFAFRFPKRVSGLSFVDPAGFDLGLPPAVKAVFWPGVGELLLGMLGRMGRKTLLESMLADFYQPTPEAIESFKARYFEQMQYRGFKRALLSSLRSGMLDEDLQLYRRLGEMDAPVQLIWGELDDTVPFRHAQTFIRLVPRAEFHPIPQAKHIPHFDRPDVVNPLLIEFLGRAE
ncbi:MAG TPA: alpha/beta hydrolase [Anaerolineales bacterium]|nr:alpha/beta hydrolase [Anaerolineales bacterium]HRQ91464.1 alpha/beta hydrolase [Anaerolineales bacterium]